MKHFIYTLSACIGLLLNQSAICQTTAADNKVSESITFSEPPKGKAVYGIFEGRTPCFDMGRQVNPGLPPGCDHLKWQIVLFRDTVTLKPASCTMRTEMFGYQSQQGKWTVTHGTKTDPAAVVYVLRFSTAGYTIYLLKGDENVLFILDENLAFRAGNADFSYTLNRVNKVLRLSKQ